MPLRKAFWDYAILGGLVVNLTTTVGFLTLVAADQPLAALVVGYGLSLPYNALALVAVWRSAARDQAAQRWANLARIVALVWLAVLSLT